MTRGMAKMAPAACIEIDGSFGEGGGQIVRSSLALSLLTGKPCRIRHIRAGRKKPGLLRQHLTALTAAAEISSARVEGAVLGSSELRFEPGPVRSGSYRFSIGTAGSTTLVLQTVLLPLALANGRSEVVLEGGTHNPFAPPFDFLERVLLPLLRRMGARVEARLERPGFYPAGGGLFRVEIEPADGLRRIDLLERGKIVARRAVASVSNLSAGIARRELDTVRNALSWQEEDLASTVVRGARGPGNVLTLEIESEHVTELFTGFGRREASAEQVATDAVRQVRDYLATGVPVGPHLADQLLVPLAVAGGGSFRTQRPTLHTRTNVETVRAFLDVDVHLRDEEDGTCTITLGDGPSTENDDER